MDFGIGTNVVYEFMDFGIGTNVVIVHVNSLNIKTLLRPSYRINSNGCECASTTAVQKG